MAARDRSRSPHGAIAEGGDDEEITSIVWQREQARLSKDFALADQLRDQLAGLGVQLFDKTNSWNSSDGRSGRIPSFTEIESGVMMEAPTKGMDAIKPMNLNTQNMGGNELHIRELVLNREQARAQKDFAKSDEIREELKAMGVEVLDKEKMWRAKSGESGVIVGYRGNSGPTDMEISVLVVQREKARQANDYTTADMIRDELKRYNIDIFDKDKVWKSHDGRSGQVPPWDVIAAGGNNPAAAAAPQAQNYGPVGQANDLRSQVVEAALAASQTPQQAKATLQLLRQAAAGGGAAGGAIGRPQGPQTKQQAIMPVAVVTKPAAARQGGGQAGLSPAARDCLQFVQQCAETGHYLQDAEIEWLVIEREKMRQNKEFKAADEIRDAMRSQLGIDLQEKQKSWKTSDGRQGAIPAWDALA